MKYTRFLAGEKLQSVSAQFKATTGELKKEAKSIITKIDSLSVAQAELLLLITTIENRCTNTAGKEFFAENEPVHKLMKRIASSITTVGYEFSAARQILVWAFEQIEKMEASIDRVSKNMAISPEETVKELVSLANNINQTLSDITEHIFEARQKVFQLTTELMGEIKNIEPFIERMVNNQKVVLQ